MIPILLRGAAATLLFAASWIFLPAPHRFLLPLSVGAPEVCAWLAVGGVAIMVAAGISSGRNATRWTALVLAAAATMMAAMPLVRLPSLVRQFDGRMEVALGGGTDRRAPVTVSQLLFGLRKGDARIVRGIPFASPDGVPLTLDIYRPPAAGRYPIVVQIYGGAWQRGAPGHRAAFATRLAARGFVVFAIDYRHAPAARWPAQIEDVRTALAWIRLHAATYDADPSRLALLGRSSGAQLAMVAGYEPTVTPVAAVVSLYGPVDLADGYRRPPRPDPLDVRSLEVAFLGGTPDEVPDRYRAASPVSYASRRLPPTLLLYGARDHVVESRYGAEMEARLRATGSTAIFLEIPWADHGFDTVPHGPSGQLALHYVERFLRITLK